MKRLDRMFQRNRLSGDRALIAYVTCGDPDPATTVEIVSALIAAGADAIELGVPFSDPIADGPVIQAASQRALARGTTMADLFTVAGQIRQRHPDVPIIAFSYLNPVLSLARDGDDAFETFAERAATAGIDGLLLTDLPVEESRAVRRTLHARGLGLVPLVAPTSPVERMKAISRAADGFVYYVSTNGVTGARSALAAGSIDRVRELCRMTKKPVAVGFGVSTQEQFELLSGVADAVVVGSAIVRAIAGGPAESAPLRAAAVVREIRGRS